LLFTIICSCHNNDFKTTTTGLKYKIFHTGQGDKIIPGQFLKLKVKQIYNDSVLGDSPIPQYQPYDSQLLSKEAYELFSNIHCGDSLVFKLSSDSAFKTSRPAFAKKKGWLITYVKVQSILQSEAEAKADLELEKKMHLAASNITKP
jgi:hypothetical protein